MGIFGFLFIFIGGKLLRTKSKVYKSFYFVHLAFFNIYDRSFEGIAWRERKRIGLYNTKKCEEVIKSMKDSVGFRDHPVTCFKIFEYKVGQTYWREEF